MIGRGLAAGAAIVVLGAGGFALAGTGEATKLAQVQAVGVENEAVERARAISDSRRLLGPVDDVVCCAGDPAYPDSKNTATGQAGSGEGAVQYRAGGRDARPLPGADTQLFGTGYGGWEPSMGIDRNGTIFYAARNSNVDANLIRSKDGGVTWKYVGPAAHKVSLDPFMWLDYDTGRIFNSDIDTVTCPMLSTSADEGASWTTVKACGVTDHQSIAGGPVPEGGEPTIGGYPNVAYYCAISGGMLANTSTTTACLKSLDGGLAWRPTGSDAFPVRIDPATRVNCYGAAGHAAVGQDGRLFVPRGWCEEPYVAYSDDEGLTWERVRIPGPKMTPGTHEAGVGADDDGNAYYTWVGADNRAYLSVSRDNGATWAEPKDVTPPGVTRLSDVTAEIAIGDPGSVAMLYLGTETAADTPPAEVTWNAYLVQTTEALAADPTFVGAVQNDPQSNPFWRGNRCKVRCGNIGDFLDVVIAPDGTPWTALVDSCPGKENTCTGFDVNRPRGEAVVGHLVGAPNLGEPAEADPVGKKRTRR